jgi:hypothetical protein
MVGNKNYVNTLLKLRLTKTAEERREILKAYQQNEIYRREIYQVAKVLLLEGEE